MSTYPTGAEAEAIADAFETAELGPEMDPADWPPGIDDRSRGRPSLGAR